MPTRVVADAMAAGVLPSVDESTSWVALYDPARAFNGYTAAFYRRRTPILLDMNGRIVHAWPEVRAKSRLRLLPNGHLLTIDLGRSVSEWSWEGERVWHWKDKTRTPHHDLIRLENGNTLVISLAKGEPADELLEIDGSGEIVWRWSATEHLSDYFDRAGRRTRDVTHMNSVQELPENRHFDAGDERFRPGNLLVSARNLSTIFVLDRAHGEVTWEFGADEGRELDFQHEALMIEPDQPGAGNIVLFDNGYRNRRRERSTEVLEIDPATRETTWSYTDSTFYSPTSGREQPLPNGNLLVASSRGGRAFELNRRGEIVWQWTPPYEPRRPQRVPYDYTPQLRALTPPEEQTVRPPQGYRYVDRDIYRFARRGEIRPVTIAGEKRNVLKEPRLCKELILPTGAEAILGYGVRASARRDRNTTFFSLALIDASRDTEVELFTDRIEPTEPAEDIWRQAVLDLSTYAQRPVTLCVDLSTPAPATPSEVGAHWANVHIAPSGADLETESDDDLTDLTEDELEARRRHLETLGYVD